MHISRSKLEYSKFIHISKTGLIRKISKSPNEIIRRVNIDIEENYIISETSYVIWLLRNFTIFSEEKKVSVPQGIAMIRNRMKLRICLNSLPLTTNCSTSTHITSESMPSSASSLHPAQDFNIIF